MKIFILMKTFSAIFNLIVYALGLILRTNCLTQSSQNIALFSSKNVIVLTLIFRYLVRFE